MKKLLLSLSLAVICFAEHSNAAQTIAPSPYSYTSNYHMLSAETITNMLRGLSNSLVSGIVTNITGTNAVFDTNLVNWLIASNLLVFSNATFMNLDPGQWVAVGANNELINTNLGTAPDNWVLQADGTSYDWGNDGSALTNVTAEHLSTDLTNYINLITSDSSTHFYLTITTNNLSAATTNVFTLTDQYVSGGSAEWNAYATNGYPIISFLSTNNVIRVEQGNAIIHAGFRVSGSGFSDLYFHPELYAWFPNDTTSLLGTGDTVYMIESALVSTLNINIPIDLSTNLPSGTKLMVKFISETTNDDPLFHVRHLTFEGEPSFLALNTLFENSSINTATYVTTAILTNRYFASNAVSGGQFPAGTVEINSQIDGWFLTSSNGFRLWSINGTALTNITANFITTSLSNTILAMITNNAITPQILNYFFTTNILYVSNAYITNLTANKATFTNVVIYGGISYGTNGWSGPSNTLPLNLARQRYITYTPYSVTGFTEKSNASAEPVLLAISNGASTNVLATFIGITSGAFTNQYTHSNNTTAKIWFEYDPSGPDTNMVFRLMK